MRFGNPSDIAVDSENRWLFTVNAVDNQVRRFDSKGRLLNTWGSRGSGDGQFLKPSISDMVDDFRNRADREKLYWTRIDVE